MSISKMFLCLVSCKMKPYYFAAYSQVCTCAHILRGFHRSGKSQGILELVREIWNFVESQGNS